jgi:hypothetical protein
MAKAGQKLSAETVAEMIRMKVAGAKEKEICEALGVAKSTVHMYCRTSGRDVPGAGVSDAGVVSFASKGDTASGEYRTATVPTEQTLPGILHECGADLTTWAVKEWSYRAWTTGMMKKGKGEAADEVIYSKQYSIHVKFVRIMPAALRDAADAVFERMKAHAPKYRTPVYRPSRDGLLAGAFIFDHHFGKLCWGRETGDDYDLKIAASRFDNAVDDMVGHMKANRVSRVLFPLGNDYLHLDSRDNATSNGTVQDVDGRLEKVVEVAEMAAIRAVEMMAGVAKVDVVWVGGNHDLTLSYMLGRTVSAWFRNHGGVTVDCGPNPRKYYRWEKSLFQLVHSDREKVADLALLMARERPKDWAETTCHEAIVGHRHHPEKWQTKPVDSKCGVTIRTIRSMSGTDAWHAGKGYIGESKAAELHYYHPVMGHDSYKIIHARDTK